MDWPKISIVTPSFNQATFLGSTIESVLSQNYPNLEYIIIDGGSTDGSVEIIKQHEKRLKYWCSEPDDGQYDALNKGFSQSTGEILAWLNSDDMYFPWAFRTVSSIMSELPEVEWLTTLRPANWDWQGFCTTVGCSIQGYSRQAFLDGRYLPHGAKPKIPVSGPMYSIQQESTFWRRDLWERVGSRIRPDITLAGDFDLWSRFYAHAELYGASSPIGGFRIQDSQKSQQREAYLAQAENSLSAMRETFGWSPNWLQRAQHRLNLSRLSGLGKSAGYDGMRVVRKDKGRPESCWGIQKYKFY
jgi:glycosyltransferase involved in cell wall biosynthesis